MNRDTEFMRMAIAKAQEGKKAFNGGAFGAVITKDGKPICAVHNLVKGSDDLTQHAELRAIQIACSLIGRNDLKNCVLYTSCEPCMMCLGACHWASFKQIFFGASAEDARNHGYDYAGSYFEVSAAHRHSEFKMTQMLREEALQVWK